MVSFTRYVVSWVDKGFSGFMKKAFNFQGARDEITEEKTKPLRPGPVEPRLEEFVKDVDTYVKDNPMLEVFFKDNREFWLENGLQAGQPRQRHEQLRYSPNPQFPPLLSD
jgi:hypothetical protein